LKVILRDDPTNIYQKTKHLDLELMTDNKKRNEGSGIAIGAALGLLFGLIYGNKSGNVQDSLALGLAIGVTIGAIFDFAFKRK
jgi:hypothetical protein